MSARQRIDGLAGDWNGDNRLWLMPTDPARESKTTARVELAAGGGFLMIRYDWADEGKPQDGVLIVRNAEAPSDDDIAWVDSFHTGGKIMHFRGEDDAQGRISGFTTYEAPGGPPWGWRIVFSVEGGDEFRVLMYNVSPDGEVYPAVEARYERTAGG